MCAREQYREDTARMRGEITELKTKAKIFQDMKCPACNSALDLPAVHFLCGHSFHQRCLHEAEECAHCEEDRRKVQDLQKAQRQTASQHEEFMRKLELTGNRFGVIAEGFGNGVFNKVSLVTEGDASLDARSARPAPARAPIAAPVAAASGRAQPRKIDLQPLPGLGSLKLLSDA